MIRTPERVVAAAALAVLLAATGCGEMLAPGEWGTFRYFGQLGGETPMRLVPPISDRDGNVYVLYGHLQWQGSSLYVGHHLGGWTGGCELHKGELQELHGFVGTATDRAWWWSGFALGAVSGETGSCHQILAYDPTTGVELDVHAAIPWVDETPTHTTMLALIKAPVDDSYFHAVVDLDVEQYTFVRPFEPDGAADLMIIGTGADADAREGYLVVSYNTGGNPRMEAIYLDVDGEEIDRVPISFDGEITSYMVQGSLQRSDGGLVAGLLADGRLLIFNDKGGGPKSAGFAVEGLVEYGGVLFATGMQGGDPVYAEIQDSGSIKEPRTWTTAETAEENLRGSVDVLDERSDPSRNRDWADARSAMGTYPLLSPHRLDNYTNASTGWLIAGPGYSATPEAMTAVAFAPVGLSVP